VARAAGRLEQRIGDDVQIGFISHGEEMVGR
jgi:hypothetical protein